MEADCRYDGNRWEKVGQKDDDPFWWSCGQWEFVPIVHSSEGVISRHGGQMLDKFQKLCLSTPHRLDKDDVMDAGRGFKKSVQIVNRICGGSRQVTFADFVAINE